MDSDLFTNAHKALEEIQIYVDKQRNSLLEAQREFDLYGVDREQFHEFTKKPYILRPVGHGNKFELIIPKFINFRAGWPVRTEGNYVVYHVSSFIDLITPLPEWLKKEMGWELPGFGASIDGNTVVIDFGDRAIAMEKLGGSRNFFSRRGNKLSMRPRARFDIMRALIRNGILPYTPKPVDKSLLRTPRGDVVLREEQMRDYHKFLEYGNVSIFAKGGAGKTFEGLFLLDVMKGEKIIFAPQISLLEQWEARIRAHIPHVLKEVTFSTYQALIRKTPTTREFTLGIFDEVQRIPSASGLMASNLNILHRAGLSATPWREDGNEDIIPALCGFPIGMDWPTGQSPDTTVWVAKDEVEKMRIIRDLVEKPTPGKTFIYVYRIAVGEAIARMLKVPFVNGKTKRQLSVMEENDVVVVSKVADAGVSMNVTKIIEADWLGGRAELGQRGIRAQHAGVRGEFHILLTKSQYREGSKDVKRLVALHSLDFDVRTRIA